MAKIKLMSLGGQDERGKSCFVVEVNEDIYVFNAGAKIPSNQMLGVNIIVADFSYLEDNISKIKGIFIGTPSFNNIMGLKLLIAKTFNKVPIYTSFVGSIILNKIFESKQQNKKALPHIVELEPKKEVKISNTNIIPFKITNSLPHSYGFVIKTQDGSIVYIDEFIISNDGNKTFESHINELPMLTKNNTLALIVGIGNAGVSGLTAPTHKTKAFYESVLASTSGRMVVGCYNNDAYSIFTLATIAKQQNRPFIIYSENFINVFSGVSRQKLYSTKNLISLPISEINNSKNAIVLVVENQDKLFSKLNKIVLGEDKKISLNSDDSITLGVVIIPGIELLSARLSDEVSRKDIQYNTLPKTINPMLQSDEDLKLLTSLLQPKYIIPINGLYKFETKFVDALTSSWIKEEQIIRLDNGHQVIIESKNLQKDFKKYQLDDKYLSSYDSLDVGSAILFEREQMGKNGVVNLVLLFDKQYQKLMNHVVFEYFGVFNKGQSNQQKIEEIQDIFKEKMGECVVYEKDKRVNLKETKLMLKKLLARIFEKRLSKRPLVLPTIVDCAKQKY